MQTDFFINSTFKIQHPTFNSDASGQNPLTSHVIKLKWNVKIMTPNGRHGIL